MIKFMYKYFPFLFYTIIIALSYYLINPTFYIESVGFVFIGLVVWNIFEYGFHRFIFHEKRLPEKLTKALAYDHVYHHRNPKLHKNLFLPTWMTAPVSVILIILFLVVFSLANTFYIYLGIVLGYFFYEFMHYSAHHLTWKLPYLKHMRKYHAIHHYKSPRTHYMVSFPLLDILFFTFARRKVIK